MKKLDVIKNKYKNENLILHFMPAIIAMVLTMFIYNKTYFKFNNFLNVVYGLNQRKQFFILFVCRSFFKYLTEFALYFGIFKATYEILSTIYLRFFIQDVKEEMEKEDE